MTRSFAVTWDYRCPFARNAHEAVVYGLQAGNDWQVRFMAFSLDQTHVEDDAPPVWERPLADRGSGLLALTWGIAVRDGFRGHFLDFHLATFAARFDQGRKISQESTLREVAAEVGLDPDAVAERVDTGTPLHTLAAEHTEAVRGWDVFGVPTFISGDEAAFVRFTERGRIDDLERFLDLLDWSRLNEMKRTRIPN